MILTLLVTMTCFRFTSYICGDDGPRVQQLCAEVPSAFLQKGHRPSDIFAKQIPKWIYFVLHPFSLKYFYTVMDTQRVNCGSQ